ncbi:MAG: GAF domain-containing protein [Candidatus Adiutrix sp.]|nr:GAF domain-containing protein [Candidatus Adiutrix sp.]
MPEISTARRRRDPGDDTELKALLELCLNNLDGFSVVWFVADGEGCPLRLRAFQSLSRNIDPGALIRPGAGLLGWAYKNGLPVNVDQVSFESERLLFYTRDEGIKSFMAVPLPEIAAVAAIDSKNRYIFTDKSSKLFMQFSQTIARVWRRLAGPPALRKTSGEAAGAAKPATGGADPAGSPGGEVCALWQGLEFCLSRSDHEGGGLDAALELVRNFTGLNWAFLTVIKPNDKKHYHLAAASENVPGTLPSKYPLSSGLAGWLHTKLKPLTIDRLKTDSHNSYIFQKNEALDGFRSFYGWPILYNDQPRGALILAGNEGEVLDHDLLEVMDCVVDRLAAQLHLDRLIVKVMEMDRIDPQTALPHRGQFLESLYHMMEVADLKSEGVDLYVLAISGLGALATRHGQETAGDILKTIAGRLKEGLRSTWRLGHASYGVFTLATPTADSAEAKTFIAGFKKSLENWPIPEAVGRAGLGLLPALASYPRDGGSPEEILEAALTALADGEED